MVLAALAIVLRERSAAKSSNSPWESCDGWRLNGSYTRRFHFVRADRETVACVEYGAKEYRISIGATASLASGAIGEHGGIDAVIDGLRVQAAVISHHGRFHVFLEGESYVLVYVDPLDVAAEGHSKESSLLAPMPGRVIAQLAQPGDRVEKGAPLMVLEAMKMECTIHAPADGRVESFHFAVGDQVTEGVELLHFNREENPPDEKDMPAEES